MGIKEQPTQETKLVINFRDTDLEEFEKQVASLEARGYFPSIRRRPNKDGKRLWQVLLACGNDVMPAWKPRPEGEGKTLAEALQIAVGKIK